MAPPRVFISYAWGDEDAWVEEFATRLRADGVDARLDRWELHPGDEIAAFMEEQVRESAFVLFICTPRFKAKADERKGGVGYEAMIATAEVMAKREEVRRKFIPVHRSGAWEEAAPSWLLGRYRIDLASERCFETCHADLLNTLLGRREAPPPLGDRAEAEPTTRAPRVSSNPGERAERVQNSLIMHNLPAQTLDFVGRDDVIGHIHVLFSPKVVIPISQPVAVSGLGGIGKTQIALRYALLHRDEFDAVLWVDAAGEDILPAIAALAETLQLSLPPAAAIEERATAVRRALEVGEPKLLVLDNVEYFKAIKPHMPRGGPTRILITTRLLEIPGAKTVTINSLPPWEAVRVLLGDRTVADGGLAVAYELCEELDYLTLALAVAREVIRIEGWSCQSLLAEVRLRDPVVWTTEVDGDLEEYLGKHPSLINLLDTSVKILESELHGGRNEIAMLEVAGWFAPVPIEPDLLQQAALHLVDRDGDPCAGRRIAGRLVRQGLASWEAGNVLFHRIVRAYARYRSQDAGKAAMLSALSLRCREVGQDMVARRLLRPALAHMEEASNYCLELRNAENMWIPFQLASCYLSMASFQASERLTTRFCERAIKDRFPLLLTAHGSSYSYLGQYEKSLFWHRQALEIYSGDVSGDDLIAARMTGFIAIALSSLGEYEESALAFESSILMLEKLGVAAKYSLSVFLTSYGRMLENLQRYSEAVEVHRRGLRLKKDMYPESDPITLVSFNRLGSALIGIEAYDEALEHLNYSFISYLDRYGPDNFYTATTLGHIGRAVAGLAMHKEAIALLNRTLDVYRRSLPPDHPEACFVRIEIVKCLHAMGDPTWRSSAEKTLESLTAALGPDHPKTVRARNLLTYLHESI